MTATEQHLAITLAIRSGDVAQVRELLRAEPTLASRRLGGPEDRTALHVVCDWPGYFPHGPEIAQILLDAGADVNLRSGDPTTGETPLHWAASSDDADVAALLIDAGADIEAPDGSIGTPLDNAIGYGSWNVARLLVARGALVDALWHAAALGQLDRLAELLTVPAESTPEKINQAFWHACAAAQRRAAELLLDRGANLNWEPDYAHGTPLDTARGSGTRRSNIIEWLTGRGALPSGAATS